MRFLHTDDAFEAAVMLAIAERSLEVQERAREDVAIRNAEAIWRPFSRG